MRMIGFKGALKVFYYLMAIDGVEDVELERFKEIGQELMGKKFDLNCDEVIGLCKVTLNSIESEEQKFDIIQGAIDEALKHQVYEFTYGIVYKQLIWDMISLAHSDGEYTEEEDRLIQYVASKLDIDKSELVEMKQLMRSALAVVNEQEELEKSDRPYSEVKPFIDEIEKRKATILEAVKSLIEDDFLFEGYEKSDKKEREQNVGQKIKNAVAPVALSVAHKTKEGVKAGSDKIKDKIKKIDNKPPFIIPTKYKEASNKIKEEAGFEADDNIYCMVNDNTYAFLQFKTSVSDEPFDYDEQNLIDFLHESIVNNNDDATGIVEIKSGKTKGGSKYLIQILKQSLRTEEGIHTGNQYILELYIEKDGEDQLIEGTFVEIGTTGFRESMVMTKLQNEDEELLTNFPEGWSADPYDPDFKQGFLMNLAEKEEYDKYFMNHPLSEARRLAEFVVGTN